MSSISIIVPVYNSEKYLKACIDSILEQNYNDFELILVDNGSIDRSCDIINSYNDSRIKLLHLPLPSVSAARNEGLKNAKKKFILFVDADDTLESDALNKFGNIISKYKTDAVVFNYFKVYKNQKTPEKLPWNNILMTMSEIQDKYIPRLVSNEVWGSVWRIIVKRDVLIKNKILFDKDLKVAEDLLFNIELFSCLKTIYISDEYLYNYFVHSTSTLNKYKEDNLKQNEVFQAKLKEVLEKYDIYYKYINEFKKNRMIMYTSSISNAARNKTKTDGYLEVKTIVKAFNKDELCYKNTDSRLLIRFTLFLMKIRFSLLIYILYYFKEKIRLSKSR